jgi:hypothetical protein
MTNLIATVIGSILCQTFIAKLTTGRFGVLHLNINGWPIRAISAPVPSVISLSSAISHDRSPHYHAVVSYYKSATFAINKIILGSNFLLHSTCGWIQGKGEITSKWTSKGR